MPCRCVVQFESPFVPSLILHGGSIAHILCSEGSAAPCADQLRTAPPLLPLLPPLSQSTASKILQDPLEPAGLNKLTQSMAFSLFNYRQLKLLIISWLVKTSAIVMPLAGTTFL